MERRPARFFRRMICGSLMFMLAAVLICPVNAAFGQDKATSLRPIHTYELLDKLAANHGKVILVNFFAAFCGPCRREMPDIQKLYESYGGNAGEDLVVLSVANPKTDDHPGNSDGSVEEVTLFLENGGYTYPALMDTTGAVFGQYGVSAFPTTFMIDREGNLFGYVSGALSVDMMENIVRQTLTGVPPSQSAAH